MLNLINKRLFRCMIKNRYNLLVKIVFQVLEIYISIALVNEHSHAPVTLTKLICLRRVFWSVVDV
ncbi:hypothetical protein C6B33_05045 [Escherichia coli]|nr:hypothetical protein [Escherichia coli]MGK22039.1 hypothetical protein [Escherichia coli]MGS04813.1 hypothetical protein [Escherichia coli]RCC94823.1 hypothetical protein C6B33_05045 [Escherichia coli]